MAKLRELYAQEISKANNISFRDTTPSFGTGDETCTENISQANLLLNLKLAMANFFLTEDTWDLMELLTSLKKREDIQLTRIYQLVPVIPLRTASTKYVAQYFYYMAIDFSSNKQKIKVTIYQKKYNYKKHKYFIVRVFNNSSKTQSKYYQFLIDIIQDLEEYYARQ